MDERQETKRPSSAKRQLRFKNDDNNDDKSDPSRKKLKKSLSFPPQSSSGKIKQSSNAVTPAKKKKGSLTSFFQSSSNTTTPVKSTAISAVVTPPKDQFPIGVTKQNVKHMDDVIAIEDDSSEIENDNSYVPSYVHKNVEYLRKRMAKIDDTTLEVFHLIKQHFRIPKNFENDRTYGPLSGSCYEERLIRAYTLNQLDAKNSSIKVKLCTNCASEGHKRDDCPQLI